MAEVDDLRAEIARLRSLPCRRQGRFLLTSSATEAACLPKSLDPSRITAVETASRVFAVAMPSSQWALRLAVACRQDIWRRLRGVRGLVPVVALRLCGEGAVLTATLCLLDGAAPTPRARNALATLLDDAAVRRNRQWADRVLPRQKRGY